MTTASIICYFDRDVKVTAERLGKEMRIAIGNASELMFRIQDKQALDLCMQLTEVIKQIDKENAEKNNA